MERRNRTNQTKHDVAFLFEWPSFDPVPRVMDFLDLSDTASMAQVCWPFAVFARLQMHFHITKLAEEIEHRRLTLKEEMEALEAAAPALRAAEQSLDDLSPKAIAEVRAFCKPPNDVHVVMAVVMAVLRGKLNAGWADCKKMLGDRRLVTEMKELLQNGVIHISPIVQRRLNGHAIMYPPGQGQVARVSRAADCMNTWLHGVHSYLQTAQRFGGSVSLKASQARARALHTLEERHRIALFAVTRPRLLPPPHLRVGIYELPDVDADVSTELAAECQSHSPVVDNWEIDFDGDAWCLHCGGFACNTGVVVAKGEKPQDPCPYCQHIYCHHPQSPVQSCSYCIRSVVEAGK